jgi:hypothetical protein
MLELLASLWAYLRPRLRQFWLTRGGGYYGLVATLTFLYLEGMDLAADLGGFPGASFDLGWIIGFFVGSIVDAALNGVAATLWPIQWLRLFGTGPLLLVLLGGTYLLYRVTRPGVLRLLGVEEEPTALPETKAVTEPLR